MTISRTTSFPGSYYGSFSSKDFIGGPSTNAKMPQEVNGNTTTTDQIKLNLIPQTHILNYFHNKDIFDGLSMKVVEGVYVPETDEELTEGEFLDLRTKGQAVAYEIIGLDGNIDVAGTFMVASQLSERVRYNKLTLDYDNLDPSGCLNAQILITTPEISTAAQDLRCDMESETLWNGNQIGKGEFIQLTPFA